MPAKQEFRHIKPTHEITDLNGLYQDFRDHRPMKYNTGNNYRKYFNKFKEFLRLEYGDDNLPLTDFDVRMLTRFSLWLRQGGRKPHYCMMLVSMVQTLFRHAMRMRIIESYPFELYDEPMDNILKNAPDMLDRKMPKEDLAVLENTTLGDPRKENTRLLFLFQRWTGMAWVDLQHYGARIKECMREDLQKRAVLQYNRVKTGEVAIIPLFPETRDLLKRLQFNVEPPAYMTYMDRLKSLFDYLGLNKEGLGAHTGRHIFGSEMLEMGFTMEAVSRMMGHSTTKQTEAVYAKVNAEKIFADVERIKKINDVFEMKKPIEQ